MKLTPATLSSEVENVKEAKSINLTQKGITHIDDISFCVNLTKLDLSKNDLKNEESLNGLKYCKSLTWLSLAKNELSGFSYVMELSNLAGIERKL